MKNYNELWDIPLPLINKFDSIDKSKLSDNQKVIYGLTKRAINIYSSVGELYNSEFTETKLILARAIFDTEILINWLLQKDQNKRIELYINGLEIDKNSLISKLKSEISTTGQILAEIFSNEIKNYKINTSKKGNWSGKTIRELTKDVYLEKSYDIGYWLMSIFVHGSVLSISDEIKLKKYNDDKLLSFIFDTSSETSIIKSLNQYPIIAILNIFKHIDSFLALNQSDDLKHYWIKLNEIVNKNSNIKTQMIMDDENVEGDLIVISEDNNKIEKKVYQSKDFKRQKDEINNK